MKRFATVIVLMTSLIATGSVYATSQKEKAAPPAMSASENATLSGKVIETETAKGYTYVRIEKKGVKTWFAVPEMTVNVGQVMTFQPGAEMRNFKSKGLNRTFESIIFTEVAPAGTEPAAAEKIASSAGEKPAPEKLSTGGSAAAVPKSTEKISVSKANGPDAYTVSEVFQKRVALNKKHVVVKAKVVKVSSNIMGKNWLHLQDGTGSAQKGTNDLVATTTETAAVGDVVTVKGVVASDKDFGYGYKYKVILEEASIQR